MLGISKRGDTYLRTLLIHGGELLFAVRDKNHLKQTHGWSGYWRGVTRMWRRWRWQIKMPGSFGHCWRMIENFELITLLRNQLGPWSAKPECATLRLRSRL